MSKKKYKIFCSRLREIADINNSVSLLNWDQETYMPRGGVQARAQQVSTLSGLAHKKTTDSELGKIIGDLTAKDGLHPKEKINLKRFLKIYRKQRCIPEEHVRELSRTLSFAQVAWQDARSKNDFRIFRPYLKKIFQLKIKEAGYVGYDESPYDVLLDNFEPELKSRDLAILFTNVRKELVAFSQRIFEKKIPADFFFRKKYPSGQQWNFSLDLLKQMLYNFNHGRQDISTHPFTTSFSPEDVRITTRIDEYDPREMIFSSVHEGGHALYEQGLPMKHYGLPAGLPVSLSIHESQSRLWENHIARSFEYWKGNLKLSKKYFPQQLRNISAEQIYRAVNIIRRSPIRTKADEITYHFHIAIRFEIEKAIVERKIKVEDAPEYWYSLTREMLGIRLKSQREGILQDIHWSGGNIGYFPTYSLGSFYAAQFMHQAEKDIGGLHSLIAQGNFNPLLGWLRKNIHSYGQLYTSEELCRKVTGEKLSFSYFMKYAENKYGKLYELRETER